MRNMIQSLPDDAVRAVCTIACVLLIAASCSSPQPKREIASKPQVVTKKKATRQTAAAASPTGTRLVSLAETVLGSPYKYGGASPKGFDCSGLVYYTHNKLGIKVPRTTRQQAQHAGKLTMRDVQPGDILFFRIYGNGISHVGIYAGNNQFIHAPSSGKYVTYASIDDPFWRKRFIKAGRLH